VKGMVRGRREILGDRAQRCPRCGETWLVLGAGEGDQHICKACGQGFRIQRRHREGHGARGRRGVRNSGAAQAEEVIN
jgi:transcription elongation factor Elf1